MLLNDVHEKLSIQKLLNGHSQLFICAELTWNFQARHRPPINRHNSLSASTAKLPPCRIQVPKQLSPTLPRRRLSSVEPKPPINSINEKAVAEKALPRISMDDTATITDATSQRTTKFKKLLLLLEPKGCMKGRDQFALYIFSPNNRYGVIK